MHKRENVSIDRSVDGKNQEKQEMRSYTQIEGQSAQGSDK